MLTGFINNYIMSKPRLVIGLFVSDFDTNEPLGFIDLVGSNSKEDYFKILTLGRYWNGKKFTVHYSNYEHMRKLIIDSNDPQTLSITILRQHCILLSKHHFYTPLLTRLDIDTKSKNDYHTTRFSLGYRVE